MVKDELLSPKEVAALLHLRPATVLTGVVGRALPWSRLSARCYRIHRAAVDAFLKARTASPPA